MTYCFICLDCKEKFDEFFRAKDIKEPSCPKCVSKNTVRDYESELKTKVVVVYDDSPGFNVSEGVHYKSRKDLQRQVYEHGNEFVEGHGIGKKQTPLYIDERQKELSNKVRAPEIIIE